MRNLITLVRVLTDARHPTGLGYSRREAELADRLVSSGANVKLYSGKASGSILELSRQLARTRSDAIVFAVEPVSAPVAARLGKSIKQLRPVTSFAFIAAEPSEIYERLGLSDLGAMIPGRSLEEVLAHPFWDIPGSSSQSDDSLYRKGILNASDLGGIGLLIANPSIEDDLAWISEQRSIDRPVRLDADGAAPTQAQSIISRLGYMLGDGSLLLQIPTTDLDPAHAQVWSSPAIAKVVAVTSDGASYEAKNFETAAKWAAEGQLVGGLERGTTYARNGIVSDYTGIYPEAGLAAALVHLDMSIDMPIEAREGVYEWAGPHMAAKSAVVLRGARDLVEPMLDRFTHDRLIETGGWPSHAYAVADHAEGAAWFDGEQESRFPLEKIGYRQFLEQAADPHAITIVQISAADDVAALEQQLALLHSEGTVRIPAIGEGFYFENICRWLTYGACRLSAMSRLQVDDAGQVTTCRDAGILGDTTKPYDRMVVEARQAQQLEQGKRNCSTCTVRDGCSRCAYLPAEWGGNYCEIRKSYPATALFFELHLVADRLSRMLGTPKAAMALAVSAEGLPCQHISPFSDARERTRPVIITAGTQHIAWQRGTTRFLRISAPLATILEGHGLGGEEEQISPELSTRFGVDADDAAKAFGQGRDKLASVGLIDA